MQLYTMQKIAKILGLAESTARMYREKFDDLIPSVGDGRARRYPEEAIEVMRVIADMSHRNIPAEHIRTMLINEYNLPISVSQSDDTDTPSLIRDTVRDELSDMLMERMNETFKAVISELSAARERETERDEKLEQIGHALDEIKRIQQEIIDAQNQQSKKRWWHFGK